MKLPNDFGINTYYEPTRVLAMRTAKSALTCGVGRAPMGNAFGVRAQAGRFYAFNKLDEFKSKMGWSEDFLTYELCGLAHVFFNVFGIKPLIVASALDPENLEHMRDEEGTFPLRQKYGREKATVITEAGIPVEGVARETVVVRLTDAGGLPMGAPLTEGEDYTLGQNDRGDCFIRPVLGGAVFPVNPVETEVTVHIAYECAEPGGVTSFDIINTLGAIGKVYPALHEVPQLLVAPGWSRGAGVSDALVAYGTKINSVFDANSIVDIDSTAEGARDYESVAEFKDKAGQNHPTQKPCWPCRRLDETHVVHYSSVLAGLIGSMEANSGAPARTESNQSLPGTGFCLEDGTPVALDIDQANRLRGYGITAGLFWDGLDRAWGAYSGMVPGTTDPAESFWTTNRFRRWYANHLVLTYFQKIDDNINRRLIDIIIAGENDHLQFMAARGWCPVGSIEFPEDINTDAELAAGHMWFRCKPSAYLPAQQINFLIELDLQPFFNEARGGAGA